MASGLGTVMSLLRKQTRLRNFETNLRNHHSDV